MVLSAPFTVFDKIILVPIATIYRDIIPDIIKIPLENIVLQIKYPISSVNYALQGKWALSMHSLKKLSTNMILTLGTGHIKLDEEIQELKDAINNCQNAEKLTGVEHRYHNQASFRNLWIEGCGDDVDVAKFELFIFKT